MSLVVQWLNYFTAVKTHNLSSISGTGTVLTLPFFQDQQVEIHGFFFSRATVNRTPNLWLHSQVLNSMNCQLAIYWISH